MAVTRIQRKALRNILTARRRKTRLKHLLAKPMVKKTEGGGAVMLTDAELFWQMEGGTKRGR